MAKRMLTAVVAGLAAGSLAWGRMDDPQPGPEGQAAALKADSNNPPEKPSVAAQLRAILDEFEAALKRLNEAVEAATTDAERSRIYSQMTPNDAEFSKRIVDLAMTDPMNPASRDALVWVLDKPYRGEGGPYGDQFGRAAKLLVDYHADDPEAVRVAFSLTGHGMLSYNRDNLLNGFYIGAESHEAKGLIRLAMGPYLEDKAKRVKAIRNAPVRKTPPSSYEVRDADGNPKTYTRIVPNSEDGYRTGLRFYDADYLLAEAERMYEEVIAEYGDVPYIRRSHEQMWKKLLAQPVPTFNNKPLGEQEIARLRRMVEHPKTLAEVAEGRLDEMFNIAPGKPAPEIEAPDIDGKPMKLSDHRGKVVALVFWGSWCGPCMAEVPHERELTEKYKGRPFTLIGVNCNESIDRAKKTIAENGMTWPQWHDGEDLGGPIVEKYHVRGYPTILVIDGKGVIRRKNERGVGLDRAVEELLKEIETR